jgi:cytochrome c oxidase assembly protein subunit 15
MLRQGHDRALHTFACVTAVTTLALVAVGGLVTSHEAGMAVPDWPTSYGYNMFFFPISKWVGGVFYEHTHRLLASAVGFLTLILAAWLWIREERAWVRWLGLWAVFAVVLQGVLGGLRVILLKDQIGILHAALAQIFLTMVCGIALFTSRWWRELTPGSMIDRPGLRRMLGFATALIFVQLLLGATMRHQHAGLAIPDFPLAYHKLWPPMDAASVATYNQQRSELVSVNPITALGILLQMIHRFMALAIFLTVGFCAWLTRRYVGRGHAMARLTLVWLGLLVIQILLGAFTIWSDKAADVATAHMAVGALMLVTGTMVTTIACRIMAAEPVPAAVPARGAQLRPESEPEPENLPRRKPAVSVAE